MWRDLNGKELVRLMFGIPKMLQKMIIEFMKQSEATFKMYVKP